MRDVSYLLDSVNLKFQGERNIDNLFTGMMSWLETQSPVGISQVGILCSQDCAKLIKDSLPPEIITDFRAMLLALSIIHCQASQTGESDIYETLEGIGVAAGHRLLMHLDQVLSPRTSTPDSNNIPTAETIKANVLIVLGTIMGIYYTTDPNNSREFHILDSETGCCRHVDPNPDVRTIAQLTSSKMINEKRAHPRKNRTRKLNKSLSFLFLFVVYVVMIPQDVS